MRQLEDDVDLFCTASQDGDDDFILWGRIGDDGGQHVCPRSPKFLKKEKFEGECQQF